VQGVRQASLPLEGIEGIEGIYLRLAALGRPRAHRRQAIDDRLLGLSLVLQTLHGSDDQVLTLGLTVFSYTTVRYMSNSSCTSMAVVAQMKARSVKMQ
jgi:hypothetical protein